MAAAGRRWGIAIIGLCSGIAVLAVVSLCSVSGLGGAAPWTGHWGYNRDLVAFGIVIDGVAPDGPAEHAGIRNGDRIDFRDVSLQQRDWLNDRALNNVAVTLPIRRAGRLEHITVVPTPIATLGAGNWRQRWILTFSFFAVPLLVIWLMFFAAIIAARRPDSRRARLLALALLAYGASELLRKPGSWTTPWLWINIASDVCGSLSLPLAAGLAVALTSTFGTPLSPLRRVVQYATYGLLLVTGALGIAATIGMVTLGFDWNAAIFSASDRAWIYCLPIVCAVLAIAASQRADRQRSAWILVPLGMLFVLSPFGNLLLTLVSSSYLLTNLLVDVRLTLLLVVPAVLTYAVISRRVLDVTFALNRAAVFAGVSVVLVGVFVLIEWSLTGWLQGASHTTNVIVSGALALVLGLSIRYIHARIERFVDNVFFYKRHEDERALSNFSKEAANFTLPDALLDETMKRIQLHTDARQAELLLREDGAYIPVRTFGNGDASKSVDENDGAIVALKTWHRPLDPHQHRTAMNGALALPMVSRGALTGVLLLGERAAGGAYAPDEVETLSRVANAVSSALDVFVSSHDGAADRFQEAVLEQLSLISRALTVPTNRD